MVFETKNSLRALTPALALALGVGFIGGCFTSDVYHLRENRARARQEILTTQRDRQIKAYEESSTPLRATVLSQFYNGQKLVLGCEGEDGHLFGLSILDVPEGEMHALAGRLSLDERTSRIEFPIGNLSSKIIQEPFEDYPLNDGETRYSPDKERVIRYAENIRVLGN